MLEISGKCDEIICVKCTGRALVGVCGLDGIGVSVSAPVLGSCCFVRWSNGLGARGSVGPRTSELSGLGSTNPGTLNVEIEGCGGRNDEYTVRVRCATIGRTDSDDSVEPVEPAVKLIL